MFGQHGAAQSHLMRERVGPSDVFLYFGWFRLTEPAASGRWRYVRHASPVHRLFGWLQVSEVVAVGMDTAGTLSTGGRSTGAKGGGLFSGADDRLTLTEPETTHCSHWRLPGWFLPAGERPSLSYHRDERRWRRDGPWACVRSVGRGQEFVFDADGIPEADAWLLSLLGGRAGL